MLAVSWISWRVDGTTAFGGCCSNRGVIIKVRCSVVWELKTVAAVAYLEETKYRAYRRHQNQNENRHQQCRATDYTERKVQCCTSLNYVLDWKELYYSL
jgi:hypothetical protein